MVDILKSNNITKKDEINLCISHYRKKVPNRIKTGFIGNLTTLIIAVASFIIVGYNEDTKKLDFYKIEYAFSSSLGIVVVIGVAVLVLKMFKNGFFMPKDQLYEELEEKLTYIYINFGKYF